MNIPFKVKLLTETAKAPHRNCESDLWDLFADNFSIMELEDFKEDEKDMGACLSKTFRQALDNENYITVFDENGESSLVEEISIFKVFASEICDYDRKPNIIEGFTIHPQGRILVKTGIALELPINYGVFPNPWYFEDEWKKLGASNSVDSYAVADIRPRSGLALKHGITVLNTPGTIDNSYRKEIGVILINQGHEPFCLTKGMKIAQMLIRPLYPSSFEIVKELKDTGRGGYG